jgi:hypothetical protein
VHIALRRAVAILAASAAKLVFDVHAHLREYETSLRKYSSEAERGSIKLTFWPG